MRIAFFDNAPMNYTPRTPYEQPLGGTASAAAYLSAALASRGHQVALINRTTTSMPVLGVEMLGPRAISTDYLNSFAAIVSLGDTAGRQIRDRGFNGTLVRWLHNAVGFNGLEALNGQDERQAWDSFVFVSDHQRRNYIQAHSVDGAVIRNAASPAALAARPRAESFAERGDGPHLIYASAPGRGLDLLLLSFPSIREAIPTATLRICSDHGIYQVDEKRPDPHRAYYAVARALPGVEFVGSTSQTALGGAFAQADILAYPTNFIETSCIVAMEAAALGCLVVGTDLGALPETMAGYGVFTPFANQRSVVVDSFARLVADTVQLAKAEPDAFSKRRADQVRWFRATHTWERRAEEWEAHLGNLAPARV